MERCCQCNVGDPTIVWTPKLSGTERRFCGVKCLLEFLEHGNNREENETNIKMAWDAGFLRGYEIGFEEGQK